MNKKAFTLVEIIIVVLILAILSTIGMISYVSYVGNARDTQRKSDIAQLSSALRLHKQQKGNFPMPGDSFNIVYKTNDNILAYQGKLNSNVQLSNIDKLPLDPRLEIPYIYSITQNRQEFQIAATLENDDIPMAVVEGNYKSVSVNKLPSIILAINLEAGSNADINNNNIKNLFVLSNQEENIPYSFEKPYNPITTEKQISEILTTLKSQNLYWQNSDFRTCGQIEEAGKSLGTGTEEYQIVNDDGALTNTGCTF